MWGFFVGSLPVIIITVLLGLVLLPSKTTGLGVRIDVGFAWFAALVSLALVPIDVATALLGRSPSSLTTLWEASYWYGFLVQVLILPLHMEFVRSGGFSLSERFIASVKVNLLFYGILLGIAFFGLVLLLFSGRLQPSNVIGFCIAFSNAYGLIGAIFLMGFGLVQIPRQLWRSADLETERRRICHVTGVQAERALDSHRRLSIAVLLVQRTDIMFPRHDQMRPYMDIVLALAKTVGSDFKPSVSELPDEVEAEDFFDREDLARLRGRLKKCIRDEERERALYVEAVQQYLQLERVQAMVDAEVPRPGASLKEQAEWLWQCKLRYSTFRSLAILSAIASIAIIVAEATIAGVLPNLSIASRALHAAALSGSQASIEVLCFVLLMYPCMAAYYAIYKLGSFAFYRMVPKHTDAYSLCYSGLFMSRFAAPLAFNFIAAVALPTSSGNNTDVTATRFYEAFGELMMRQPLIGLQFNNFAPALLVPYVLLIASGFFDRLVGLIFTKSSANLQFEDDWETTSNYAREGRRLLRMEGENARKGLPIGLPLDTPTAISGPAVLADGSSSTSRLNQYNRGGGNRKYGDMNDNSSCDDAPNWWQRMLGKTAKDTTTSGGGGIHQSSSNSNSTRAAGGYSSHSHEAEAARDRLARTLGRSGGGHELYMNNNSGSILNRIDDQLPLLASEGGSGGFGGGSGGDDMGNTTAHGGGKNVFERLDASEKWSSWKQKYASP